MEFRVLGPLEVVDGSRLLDVSGARERALLAVLLIHSGEVVAADRLIEELWSGDIPANPANALQVVVSRVRKALEVAAGPGRLVTRKPGYLLDVRPEEVDAVRFGRLVAEARQAGPAEQARAASLLEEALGLWRGPALAEFAAEGFARDEIARLEEERFRAVEMKADAQLALGRPAELVGELTALVAAHPLRERLRGQLMLALYRSGRQGDALRVFADGRGVLADELGVDPGPELRELHQRILVQAASLMPAQEAVAPSLPVPVTSFVGRHAELTAAASLLRGSRLVTLTGPGGTGKTRLAIELARTVLASFPDGAWLVELEAVTDPAMVPSALAAVPSPSRSRDWPAWPPPGGNRVGPPSCSGQRNRPASAPARRCSRRNEPTSNGRPARPARPPAYSARRPSPRCLKRAGGRASGRRPATRPQAAEG
jgi:DNA-binding SARP family transcriptional activator